MRRNNIIIPILRRRSEDSEKAINFVSYRYFFPLDGTQPQAPSPLLVVCCVQIITGVNNS